MYANLTKRLRKTQEGQQENLSLFRLMSPTLLDNDKRGNVCRDRLVTV